MTQTTAVCCIQEMANAASLCISFLEKDEMLFHRFLKFAVAPIQVKYQVCQQQQGTDNILVPSFKIIMHITFILFYVVCTFRGGS